jgi:hypothetical protein
MRLIDNVAGGTDIEEFIDTTLGGEQFALF